MDAHSSSLLSPNAPAPDQLAEERSAHSQVYSDTRSSDPESSPQPLASPPQNSQDATNVTDESVLISQIVDNLKNRTCVPRTHMHQRRADPRGVIEMKIRIRLLEKSRKLAYPLSF